MSDVVQGKIRNIRDHVRRLREVDPGDLAGLENDLMRQESVLLNLQRACQASIDLALHVANAKALGPVSDSRAAFQVLAQAGVIERDLAARLEGMVGFRNLAVHQYHRLDLRIVRSVLDERLDDLLAWCDRAAAAT